MPDSEQGAGFRGYPRERMPSGGGVPPISGKGYGTGARRTEGGGIPGEEPAGRHSPPPGKDTASGPPGYTNPCAIIARATLMNPAMLAPTTKFPGDPNSSAASEHVS